MWTEWRCSDVLHQGTLSSVPETAGPPVGGHDGGSRRSPPCGEGIAPRLSAGGRRAGAAVPLLAVLSGSLLRSSWALAPTGLTVGVVRTNFSS